MELVGTISWDEFAAIDLRVGRVIDVQDFPEARKPAFQIKVDFGDEIGIRKSSAQLTDLYSKDDLLGKQIIGVVNLLPKQIGPIISEFLITGFIQKDGSVILAVPDKTAEVGGKLS
ncbi:MAG: tRNA-binding protein [Spirochaetales bacterium]|nr:tRNA-binding protein [Spirochaetales bacterium]